MPVEKAKKITYYSINKNSRIYSTNGDNKEIEYKSIWGFLSGIDLKTDHWKKGADRKYHFTFSQPGGDSTEVLQVREGSSAARGIIFSLLSIPQDKIQYVRISPYMKKHEGSVYTNVWVEYKSPVSEEWKEIEWERELLDHLPEQREIELMDRVVLDDSERREYIRKLAVRVIKTKLITSREEPADSANHQEEDVYSYTNSSALATHPMYERQKAEERYNHENSDVYTYEYDELRERRCFRN